MRIKIGQQYITRDGRKATVVEERQSSVYPFYVQINDSIIKYSVTGGGQYRFDAETDLDLVEEYYPEKPKVDIDQMRAADYVRGVAKLWDIGRLW